MLIRENKKTGFPAKYRVSYAKNSTDRVTEILGVTDSDGVTDRVIDILGVTDTLGVIDLLTVTLGVTDGLGDAVGVGVGHDTGVPAIASPLPSAVIGTELLSPVPEYLFINNVEVPDTPNSVSNSE